MAAIELTARSLPWRLVPRRSGKWIGLAAGAAALVCAAPVAWAQGQGRGQGPAPQTPSIDALHSALHLSQGQNAAWRAYRAVVAAPSKAQDRRGAASQMFPSLTAPQRMDLVEAEMKQELLDLQQQSQALKLFYGNLSPDQKSVFDAQTLPRQDADQQPGQ